MCIDTFLAVISDYDPFDALPGPRLKRSHPQRCVGCSAPSKLDGLDTAGPEQRHIELGAHGERDGLDDASSAAGRYRPGGTLRGIAWTRHAGQSTLAWKITAGLCAYSTVDPATPSGGTLM